MTRLMIRRDLSGPLVAGLLVASCAAPGTAPTGTLSAQVATPTAVPSVEATLEVAPSGTYPMAGPFAPTDVEGLQVETDVEFTEPIDCGEWLCPLVLDVVAPGEAAEPLPTIVLLQGGPVPFHERRNGPMIFGLVRQGAVVFTPSYRNAETGSFDMDETYHDIRCAVRYAREHTADFGGDPERILVVGQSYGSIVGLQTAIEGDDATPACHSKDGSGLPDAVVGVGAFAVRVSGPAADDAPPMWLVAGSEDYSNIGDLESDRLIENGYDVTYEVIDGADHPALFDPGITPRVPEIIFEAAEALATGG